MSFFKTIICFIYGKIDLNLSRLLQNRNVLQYLCTTHGNLLSVENSLPHSQLALFGTLPKKGSTGILQSAWTQPYLPNCENVIC